MSEGKVYRNLRGMLVRVLPTREGGFKVFQQTSEKWVVVNRTWYKEFATAQRVLDTLARRNNWQSVLERNVDEQLQ